MVSSVLAEMQQTSSESSKRTRIETSLGWECSLQLELRANHPREQGLKLIMATYLFLRYASSESSKRTRIETNVNYHFVWSTKLRANHPREQGLKPRRSRCRSSRESFERIIQENKD